jgi:hypothetical protein
MRRNVGSYTQGWIAGDLAFADLRFLSGRTSKSSGEPPTELHRCRTCRVADVCALHEQERTLAVSS